MTTLVPHSYQYEAVDCIFDYFGSHTGNPLVAMPTGTGKSVVIATFLERVFRHYPQSKVLNLTHVKELIQQNYMKLLTLWPGAPAGINSAGLGRRDIHHRIVFAGIGSVAKYAASFGHIDLVLIDEADLVSEDEAAMYRVFIAQLKAMNPLLKVIGFTATPFRTGLGMLTEGTLFTDICFDITSMEAFNRLIHEGYLCPLITKRTQTVLSTDGVKMRGGDFISKDLQKAVDRDEVTEAACREAIELASDRNHWLVFCAGVEHVLNTTAILNSLGVSAIAIHSKMSSKERDAAIRDWKAGKYRAAVNNNILTTGIDFPQLDCILMLRPTMSARLWIQMLGRGTRCVYAPGFSLSIYEERMRAIELGGKRNTLVLDYAGNIRRLGPINDPVIPRKKGDKGGDAPVRICEDCGMYNHASYRYCGGKKPELDPFTGELVPVEGYCGAEFPVANKLQFTASEEPVIKGEMPIVEVFKVDHITYSEHIKQGAKPGMRVTYYCGLRRFTEYVLLEHENQFAARKGRSWWRERSDLAAPLTTAQALERATELKTPTHLRVWVNKQYPQIMSGCYDGTAFGAQQAKDSDPGPSTEVKASRQQAEEQLNQALQDDDIPF
jgi:DNA repair protein RadD